MTSSHTWTRNRNSFLLLRDTLWDLVLPAVPSSGTILPLIGIALDRVASPTMRAFSMRLPQRGAPPPSSCLPQPFIHNGHPHLDHSPHIIGTQYN